MKRVPLDKKSKAIKEFIQSLPVDGVGCILSIRGKPVLKVTQVRNKNRSNAAKLRKAILARRDESRRLNAEWEHVDREAWNQIEKDDSQ